MYKKLIDAYESVRQKTDFCPQIGIVLGSGLGELANSIDIVATVDYKDIINFPISTVSGHTGRFVFGYIDSVPVVIMQGRVHYYEGYKMEDVVLPIRLMALMKIKALLLTNAAGGVNLSFKEGTLMSITDHICFAPNPLIGKNIEQVGVRFPDMTTTYNKQLLEIIQQTAKSIDVELKEGIYVQLTGPSYETPAEIRMLRILGVDAVGMSTACEAIAANHMKVKIAGISCITNMAAGVTGNVLSHKEVEVTANKVKDDFIRLIRQSIINISKVL